MEDFFFFGETHQTDPKIHVEDITGRKEMFLKKNDSGVFQVCLEIEGL